MSSSREAFEQLNNWKSKSTKLFLHSAENGLTVWCAGTLQHVASSELHFGIEGIDGRDFLISMVTSFADFTLLDNRDSSHFFALGREKTDFGTVLQIDLRPGGSRVILAELFSGVINVSPK